MAPPIEAVSNGCKSQQRIFARRLGLVLSVLTFLNSGATLLAQTASGFSQEAARSSPQSQSPMETQMLEFGKPIERELKGGETHSYRITLTAGQYLEFAL